MPNPADPQAAVSHLLHGGADGLGFLRELDWTGSPIGAPQAWSPSLRTTVGFMLAAQAQIVLFWGPQFVALYNDAYAPTIGDKHPRALGRPGAEFWAELWDDLEPLLQGVRTTGQTFSAADRPFYIERHGYGETVYFDVSYSAVPEADGSVGGVLCIVSETTQRVLSARRQTALLELEDALRRMDDAKDAEQFAVDLMRRELDVAGVQFANADLGQARMCVTAYSDNTVAPSPFMAMDERWSRETFSMRELAHDSDAAARVALDIPVLRSGQIVALLSVDYAAPRRHTQEEANFARSVAERAWAAAERARAQAQLRQVQARQQQDAERVQLALGAGAIIGTWLWDLPTDRFIVDEQFAINFGLDPALGREGLSLAQIVGTVHPEDKAGLQQAIEAAIARGGHYAHQYRVRRADGRYYWIEANGRVDKSHDGRPLSFPGVLIDIEGRREAEQRIAASEAKYRTLFEEVDEGFCVIEFFDGPHGELSDYVHVEANPAYAVNAGIPDVVGQKVRTMVPEEADEWVALYRRVLLTGEPIRVERELKATGRYLELAAFRVEPPERRQVAVLFKDVTVRKRAEVELQSVNRELSERVAQEVAQREAALARVHEMQKLETIGQLTGGVAHDFNNLLTPIVGALDMIQQLQGQDERIRRLTGAALQAAERARILVQRLLAFARRQHLEAKPINVGALVSGMEDLLSRSLGPQVQLTIACDAGLPPALIDPNQLELALLNLAVNARDAMPHGGRLRIHVAQEGGDGARHTSARYIRVAVSDTGQGMDDETIRRAIEPFFTTKAKGHGTGLGLSMVHGLAAQSGGYFDLTSMPGGGTTATLWLPVSEQGVVQIEHNVEHPHGRSPLRRAASTPVLLVDDEELVRTGTADMLADAGYVVQQASSARQALALLGDGLQVAALITDYAMPGMTGAQLASEVARLRPALPVLMITGFASLHDGMVSDLPRLAKPFRQAELCDALADLLERRAGA